MITTRLLILLISLAMAGAIDQASAKDFEKSSFKASSGDEIRYALMSPETVKKGQQYPLVITLHGIGGRGVNNWEPRCYANTVLSKPEMRKEFPCFVVAPTTGKGETWWSSEGLKGKPRLPDVFDLIEELLAKNPIDSGRIYVTGQSMGGFGTFGAIAQRPDLFAAAAPVCGGYDPKQAKAFASIPIWVFHGAKDTAIPTDRSREMVKALKSAGGEPIYTEFPDASHNSWTPTYDNKKLWQWLFDQRRN